MKQNRLLQIVYALCFGGLILHLRTAFWESSDPGSKYSVGLLIWSMLPYLIIIGVRKITHGALCAAVVVFLLDLSIHLEAFVWPSSSTAALGLLFMPLWNLILIIPLSFLAVYMIEKRIKKRKANTDS